MSQWYNRVVNDLASIPAFISYYEDELEEVELEIEAPIMEQVTFRLDHDDVEAIKDIAKDVGVGHTTLVRMWVKEKLKTTKAS